MSLNCNSCFTICTSHNTTLIKQPSTMWSMDLTNIHNTNCVQSGTINSTFLEEMLMEKNQSLSSYKWHNEYSILPIRHIQYV